MVAPDNGILLSNKKEWTTHKCYNTEEPQKHCAKWNKPHAKDHTLYYSTYMKCPENKNL